MRSSLGGEQECVRRGKACPCSRHGSKQPVPGAKIYAIFAPIPASACDLDLAFPKGMERMGDATTLDRAYCVRCS
jgi:hypothetical protein